MTRFAARLLPELCAELPGNRVTGYPRKLGAIVQSSNCIIAPMAPTAAMTTMTMARI